MKICAVICEFNPFHRGHSYLLDKLRENGATHIVCIMSGNFVQRAQPAILPKEIRAETAILNGADLVIELPLPYATDTADRFAFGACEIIKKMGCVDLIGFGCENDNKNLLIKTSQILTSDILPLKIKKYTAMGVTFAKARENAVSEICSECGDILKTPNNILAVEYLKHLNGSNIEPIAVNRAYVSHDYDEISNGFASASYIRKHLTDEKISSVMPKSSYEKINEAIKQGKYYDDKDLFELLMLSQLRRLSIEDIKNLPNISEGLENRIYNSIQNSTSFNEFLLLAKTKRYSLSRIKRIALSGFLGIDKQLSKISPPYLRVLGFNERGKEILTKIKENSFVPMSHSLKKLSENDRVSALFANVEINSTNQYELLLKNKGKCSADLTFKPIKA